MTRTELRAAFVFAKIKDYVPAKLGAKNGNGIQGMMRKAIATSRKRITTNTKDQPMKASVIRISVGKFDAYKAVIVEEKLRESRAGLENGIRAMNGNIAYYVGIDRSNNAMHNVSFWENVADANQMATFAPMIALGAEFAALGVRFDRPILNCNTLWQLDGK